MMNMLLLETTILWGSFAGGLELQDGKIVIPINNNTSAERAVAALSGIVLVGHIVMSALVYVWKDDLDGGANGGSVARGKYHPVSSASFSADDPSAESPMHASRGYQQTNGDHHHGMSSEDLKNLSSFVIGEEDDDDREEL